MNNTNKKIFSTLLAATMISVACVFPYVLSIQKDVIAKIGKPVEALFVAQFIQSAIMFALAIAFGLRLAAKAGFRLPLLEAFFAKRDWRGIFKSIFAKSVAWGVIAAVLIFGMDPLFGKFGAGISTHENLAPMWQKLIAAFYGGITEEVLMRLFLMSFLVWLGMKLTKRAQASGAIVWISILIASVIFGLGHLPITASVTSITPLVVLRAVVLNGIGGFIFGWLYWKRGLESAIIAHFTADIFLLSLLPLLVN